MGASVAYMAVAALAGAAAGGAFSKGPPAPPPPKPMPLPDDASNMAARRSELAQQQALHGRASTILTGDSDRLGG